MGEGLEQRATQAKAAQSAVAGTSAARLLIVCFFLSGVGSLVLEVVWTRMLRLAFGSTTLAVSTTLVAYMLGLGLGALVAGRISRRLANGAWIYGWLEIAIGLYALAVPALFALLPPLGRSVLYALPFWPAALLRFGLALAVLALPTAMMGATLPLVVSTLVRSRAWTGRAIALLYGVNTLGAVTGVMLATFVLFEALGLLGAGILAAVLDLVVGAFVLGRVAGRLERSPLRAEEGSDRPSRARSPVSGRSAVAHRAQPLSPFASRLAVWVYAAVGFTALLYEVAWTRALSMTLGSSIYAFAVMLAAFLLGIGLGSLIAGSFLERLRRPLDAFAIGVGALGLTALATLWLLPELPALFLAGVRRLGLGRPGLLGLQVGVCVLAMLPATLLLGGLFPLLASALARDRRSAGEGVGVVYFANTLGSAAGAFGTGFLLLPWLGIASTLALGVALNVIGAAVMVVGRVRSRRRLGIAVVWCVIGLALAWLPIGAWDPDALASGAFYTTRVREAVEARPLPEGVEPRRLLYYRDGLNSTVSVHRFRDNLTLSVNGKPDASSISDMATQVLIAHIPLLFGAPARDVLVIGWASGVTVGSAARHPVSSITAVELEPVILEASRLFDAQSGAPLGDPRVEVVIDDGRSFLSYADERYDVIISEPSNPWMTGAASLFTVEAFRAARLALAPGGRLLQWVHLYSMDPDGLRSILAALRAAFPYVYGFAYGFRGDLLLLATLEPLRAEDLPRWEELPLAVREDLTRVRTYSTADLWSLLRLTPADVRALVGEGAVPNSDDNMRVELESPWFLYTDTLPENWQLLHRFARGVTPLLFSDRPHPDAEMLGALALSYVSRGPDPLIGPGLLARASSPEPSANALTADVFLARSLGSRDLDMQLARMNAAVERRPDLPLPRLMRAQVLLELGRPDQARRDLEVARVARADDPRVSALHAVALNASGRYAEAAAAFEVLYASPFGDTLDALPLRIEAATAWYRLGKPGDGVRHLQAYLSRDPFSAGHWRALAAGHAALGETEAAERAKRNARALAGKPAPGS